jgi:hypothetical protein
MGGEWVKDLPDLLIAEVQAFFVAFAQPILHLKIAHAKSDSAPASPPLKKPFRVSPHVIVSDLS